METRIDLGEVLNAECVAMSLGPWGTVAQSVPRHLTLVPWLVRGDEKETGGERGGWEQRS
jgi:hypothetical protein